VTRTANVQQTGIAGGTARRAPAASCLRVFTQRSATCLLPHCYCYAHALYKHCALRALRTFTRLRRAYLAHHSHLPPCVYQTKNTRRACLTLKTAHGIRTPLSRNAADLFVCAYLFAPLSRASNMDVFGHGDDISLSRIALRASAACTHAARAIVGAGVDEHHERSSWRNR